MKVPHPLPPSSSWFPPFSVKPTSLTALPTFPPGFRGLQLPSPHSASTQQASLLYPPHGLMHTCRTEASCHPTSPFSFLKVLPLRYFPSGPVVRSLCFHCRAHGFDPWLGNMRWPHHQKKKSSPWGALPGPRQSLQYPLGSIPFPSCSSLGPHSIPQA